MNPRRSDRVPEPIDTPRLILFPATAELVAAELESPGALAAVLGAGVPEGWPPEPLAGVLPWLAAALAEVPDLVGWEFWYWIAREGEARRLVGSGGFKGKPVDGLVEIGYITAEGERERGYASEAVAELVKWALGRPGVERVAAEVLPGNQASIRVLERCGFRRGGEAVREGHWRFVAGAV